MKIFRTIYRLALTALTLGAVLTGCSAIQEDDPGQDGRREIKFTASVGTYQVKATDTSFEGGDAVGLFAEAYFSANNLRLEWDGQHLVPQEPLYWGPVNQVYRFAAYYPYNPEWMGGNRQEFVVNSDQTTHKLFTESDLMMASARVTTADGDVNFHFHHVLSKIIIHIDNQLEEEISEVFMGDIYGAIRVYPYDLVNFELSGTPGTIKAGAVTTAAGDPAWALIVPPQTGRPTILITTVSGKQYTCTTEGYIGFENGCCYNANVTLDENLISTEFTEEVTEWVDNKDLMFHDFDWGLTGSFTNWSYDYQMGRTADKGIFELELALELGDEFKFRRDFDWDFNYGIGEMGDAVEVAEGTYPLTRNGSNITMATDGRWKITLDILAETVTFTLLESFGSEIIWTGSQQIEWDAALQDFAYEAYDWSTVAPGTILRISFAQNNYDWWCMRVADGYKWEALPGLPDLYECPSGAIEVFLTEEILDQLVNNGGLIIYGTGITLKKLALVKDRFDYTPSADYLSDANIWKAVDENSTLEWFYCPGWGDEKNPPSVGKFGSTYVFTNAYDTNDYWQAQMWIMPNNGLYLDPNKTYSFSCTIYSSNYVPFFVKMYEKGVDYPSSFESDRYTLGYRQYTYRVNEFTPLSTSQCLLFDFGGIAANTRVYIKDIVLKEVGGGAVVAEAEAVDLGLSVKWANINLGAASPEQCGTYYAWGETTPKQDYKWDTYKWCLKGNGTERCYTLTKYNTDAEYGEVDYVTVLDADDDAASYALGANWRMPTQAEWEELVNSCEWSLTAVNGQDGYIVSGNGNNIFLPLAGFAHTSQTYNVGGTGYYWTANMSQNMPDHGVCTRIDYDGQFPGDIYGKFHGFSVRAVTEL
ncbi:MAG: fimbrillin family protein [Bacteroidales bacterium]|nr:fimbrillin family protein [Bacteroidales bacterium]